MEVRPFDSIPVFRNPEYGRACSRGRFRVTLPFLISDDSNCLSANSKDQIADLDRERVPPGSMGRPEAVYDLVPMFRQTRRMHYDEIIIKCTRETRKHIFGLRHRIRKPVLNEPMQVFHFVKTFLSHHKLAGLTYCTSEAALCIKILLQVLLLEAPSSAGACYVPIAISWMHSFSPIRILYSPAPICFLCLRCTPKFEPPG